MRFLGSAQRYISSFISHSSKDYNEAEGYERVLEEAGFSVFQYGEDLQLGSQVQDVVRDRISKCHFFFLVVSEHSLNSPWVQRELGLAVALQKQRKNYRPIIIPIYAKDAEWRKASVRPRQFPVRDFETGEPGETAFNLGDVRGVDKYANPQVDSDERLIAFLRPSIWVTRLDFWDHQTFYDSGVFDLYEDLFPAIERDDPQDIIRWTLHGDIGVRRSFVISNGKEISYTLDSRYFILKLADRAVGLGFFTYDFSSELIYGNYIGVQECWRGGNIAGNFFSEIMVILQELFPTYKGMVFEVEKFSRERVEGIVSDLKRTGARQVALQQDRDEVRKFLRVSWYHKLGCYFFFDKEMKEPLVCRSPCLDLTLSPEGWAAAEEDYWIMWYGRPGALTDYSKRQSFGGGRSVRFT
ncbi:toll/interleukin-1 receptor domain-containing protein [Bradyrhizobium sp. AUGA SZCCT0160]|uniref:toll/interleukin-1 receptor domain-containing protein n=1 Tax=Bradyrhizobium sp. AUGA SZCCT0160 TaxID=2807662 RepID=UPI001BA5E21B|nr:toll/interleukin-1 receptor domain-containing protein [Bradyrhizobium sp. AUGA SZCCT0160]MBR1188805.1 toll/interleukin-1 receptor domain-containing protein [Bradyrhizobium sp. AUGA SZCCT0160]